MSEPTRKPAFAGFAQLYDRLSPRGQDVAGAVSRLDELIRQVARRDVVTALDVACGTGVFLPELARRYAVEGIDLSPDMIALAKERCPGVPIHEGDLVDFDLGRQFDAVLCLGSSIAYASTVPRLRQAVQTLARHVAPGGVVAVEPWFWPEVFRPSRLSADFIDEPACKVARFHVGRVEGRVSVLDFWFLVGTPGQVDSFTEEHRLGLFTDEEYREAFTAAGLLVTHEPEGLGGLSGRGLYIGVRSSNKEEVHGC